jgi:hypothetical protein
VPARFHKSLAGEDLFAMVGFLIEFIIRSMRLPELAVF